MISSVISHLSALVLAVAGAALLFASDVVLPSIVPGLTASAAWLGQLLGAAWLGVAGLNWLSRRATLGGVYGRPVVLANFALYVISALSLVRVLDNGMAQLWLWPAFIVSAAFALSYGALLLRGPLGKGTRAAN